MSCENRKTMPHQSTGYQGMAGIERTTELVDKLHAVNSPSTAELGDDKSAVCRWLIRRRVWWMILLGCVAWWVGVIYAVKALLSLG